MIYQAIVTDVADPKQVGRIRVQIRGFGRGADESPWVYPCTALAGPQYGLSCLPEIGDEVWVTRTNNGLWVYLGFLWLGQDSLPVDASPSVRVFRTPTGHQVKFDEAGDIAISHAQGAAIVLKANGEIHIGAAAEQLAPLGEAFRDKINALIDAFESHTHQVSTTGSATAQQGTAAAPSVSVDKVGADDLSKKVRIG